MFGIPFSLYTNMVYTGVWDTSKFSSIVNLGFQYTHVSLRSWQLLPPCRVIFLIGCSLLILLLLTRAWNPHFQELRSRIFPNLNFAIVLEWIFLTKSFFTSSFLLSFSIIRKKLCWYTFRQGNASHIILRCILYKAKWTYLSYTKMWRIHCII